MTTRVLITAGASGIGLAIAKAFAGQGDQVFVGDVDADAIAALEGSNIAAAQVDVANEAAVDAWLAAVLAQAGGIDVLINNAGIAGPSGPVEDMDLTQWRQCMAVGLDSQMLTCRHLIPGMKDRRAGSIINISSVAGLYGYPFRSPYAAAKWAVLGFTKSLAAEIGPWNIRCNAICPGSVTGERMERVIANEAHATGRPADDIRHDYTAGVSLRRFVEPEEIADMCLFLASPAAKMVSGQVISVDGHTETYHSE